MAKMKVITTKTISDDRAKFLNTLKFFKENSIKAVNTSWYTDGQTKCELYSMKTKKRISIKTNLLFDNKEFAENPNTYCQNNDKIKALTLK